MPTLFDFYEISLVKNDNTLQEIKMFVYKKIKEQ